MSRKQYQQRQFQQIFQAPEQLETFDITSGKLFAINIVISLVLGQFTTMVQKKQIKFPKMSYFIICALMTLSIILIYNGIKTPNAFQIMGVERTFDPAQFENYYQQRQEYLNENFKNDQKQLQYENKQLELASKILQNSIRRKVYDKFLVTSPEVNQRYLSQYGLLQHIINAGSSYMIILLIVITSVEKKILKQSIKHVYTLLMIFNVQELSYILEDTDKPSILDSVFPTLTIAERADILKLIVGPLMNMLLVYIELYVKTEEDQAYINQEEICKEVSQFQEKDEKLKEELTKLKKNKKGYKKLFAKSISDQTLEKYSEKSEINQQELKEIEKRKKDESKQKYIIYLALGAILFMNDIRDFLKI